MAIEGGAAVGARPPQEVHRADPVAGAWGRPVVQSYEPCQVRSGRGRFCSVANPYCVTGIDR
jgi:hypothetical protein